ncbi:hypothetical protein CSKR_103099 [Clonorchis sinensis]|uniref:Uncharacterized protein n=1 Tax=Clonorchis sinensis TaxID=79923 RepID=A0A3R7H794_CLOSI|nr:hypothetical protein CSKR_103099 [Clonorchis sinensis]
MAASCSASCSTLVCGSSTGEPSLFFRDCNVASGASASSRARCTSTPTLNWPDALANRNRATSAGCTPLTNWPANNRWRNTPSSLGKARSRLATNTVGPHLGPSLAALDPLTASCQSAGVSDSASSAAFAAAQSIFRGPLLAAPRTAFSRPLRKVFSTTNLPRSDSSPVSSATSSNSSRKVRTSPTSKSCSHGMLILILVTATNKGMKALRCGVVYQKTPTEQSQTIREERNSHVHLIFKN